MTFYTLKDFDLQTISQEKLGEILIEAKKVYYTTGKPIMDDHTYDTLEEVLRHKYPHHRIFSKVGHPNFETGFDKKKHQMLMGSLNKVNSYEDLIHYFELKKVTLLLVKGGEGGGFVVQPKCDGISLEIIYQDGQLVEAITRGDGQVGDLVTQNVVKMKNAILHLPQKFTGSIRCEIVVTYKDFENLNVIASAMPAGRQEARQSQQTDRHDPSGLAMTYSNPRNAASGITQRLDGLYSDFCTLLAVDIGTPKVTEFQQVEYLKELGFTTVETFLCQNYQEIENIYQDFFTTKRAIYDFDIDGLVIKINDTQIQKQLGSLNLRPKGQVAYKFPSLSNTSRIITINWQVGPLGTITPVAQIEPVVLSGAIITYASLANIDLIEEKGININDIIEVSRRGDVIPHIENVVTKVTPGHAIAPTNCPQCQTTLLRDHKFLRCPNSSCPAQTLGLLRLFCQVLDIKGISDKTIAKLVEAKKVTLPGDFFKLTPADFINLENLGEKSAQNIINQIQAKKTVSLIEAFHSASIPNFSKARIKQLVNAGYNTPQKLLGLSIQDLQSLPGIQSTLAIKIFAGLQLRLAFIESILSQVQISNLTFDIDHLSLTGLSFAITGTQSRPRKVIESDIETNGGKVVSQVSQNTTYLVSNDTTSSSDKIKNATKFNIPIITEENLYKLINGNP